MRTHNICFYGEKTKIIPKLSLNTLFICSTDFYYMYFIVEVSFSDCCVLSFFPAVSQRICLLQGEKEAPVAYTVFTVFLIVGMAIYYCVAVNYFL